MIINLDLLLTRLFMMHPECKTEYASGAENFTGLHLLPQDRSALSENYLYVAGANALSNLEELPINIYVLVVTSDPYVDIKQSNLILLHSDLEPALIFNDLQKCFNELADWERQIDFEVFRGSDFQKLLDISETMIGSAILVYDPALKLLAYSRNQTNLKDHLYQTAIKNGYLEREAVQFFEGNKTFEAINTYGQAYGEANEYRVHDDFIQTINLNNQLAVYCILLFTDQYPRSYEQQLFLILCDAFKRLLEKQHATFLRDRSVADYFLMDLLDTPEMTIEQIKERIYFSDLSFEGNYCLLTIRSEIARNSAVDYFIQALRTNLINSRVFSYKDTIVVLYQMPQSVTNSYQQVIREQLTPILNTFVSHKLRIYVSRSFPTLNYVPAAYAQDRQLMEALSKENGSTEEIRLYFFDDHWIHDLIQQNMVSDKLFFYCEPLLLELLKKDTKKSQQQLHILYEYLYCDRNFTMVATKLNMHRNNVIYHIKNMEEQYHIDFGEANVRLKYIISFEILKSLHLF